ncbi:MAG TPA: exodeoxyribonuclease III [Planctomycetota bacterium]|jgi:exodeoxyribonuclease-3|nr:exodeoxyribonuclease III [Planctomycetota bacterium]
MRIATWNVNSIRARLPRVLPWLAEQRPDIVLLQETKCLDEVFPREAIEELGYNIETYGQKTYNGVAILARSRITDVQKGLRDEEDDPAARVIAATVGDVMVLSVYVINGQEVGAPAYAKKLEWLKRLRKLMWEKYIMTEKVVMGGDFNVTFDDRDVYDPDEWREKIFCSTLEREAMLRMMDSGLKDAFRKHTEDGGHYTWWDFRTRAFQRGAGLRIDHFLMSPPAYRACTAVEIDVAARTGEKPSDHAPVVATLE